jgi:hypothetical protein
MLYVTDAMNQYEDLKRELTNLSRKLTTEGKVEEGSPDTFDLTEFLHGVSQERGSAGLKEKRLGLIWKNLTVKVGHSSGLFLISILHWDFRMTEQPHYVSLIGSRC